MTPTTFHPTLEQQIALSMAYLAYSGEKIPKGAAHLEQRILKIINDTIPKIPVLTTEQASPDWQVVWGPTVFTFQVAERQDNMMFVAQSRSQPDRYIIAIRGTNSDAILDWLVEDFAVWKKVDWQLPNGVSASGTPQISAATQNGLDNLLNKMAPVEGMPGAGKDITAFLALLAAQNERVSLTFTGHSLAGALAPTLALWFKQSQGLSGHWDPENHANITTIPFAGATAGNSDFATYFNSQVGASCQRIHNLLDVVPHAWETDSLETLPDLYLAGGISMPDDLRLLLDGIEFFIRDYEQVATDYPFSWQIQPEATTYTAQLTLQHVDSYPTVLGVPELKTVIQKGASTTFKSAADLAPA